MKVICIDTTQEEGFPPIDLEFGECYTAVAEKMFYGDKFYRLAERVGAWYEAKYLIPVSDIDETEMVREIEIQVTKN